MTDSGSMPYACGSNVFQPLFLPSLPNTTYGCTLALRSLMPFLYSLMIHSNDVMDCVSELLPHRPSSPRPFCSPSQSTSMSAKALPEPLR